MFFCEFYRIVMRKALRPCFIVVQAINCAVMIDDDDDDIVVMV